MKNFIKQQFAIDKKPHKGLFGYEYAIIIYAAITLLLGLFFYTKMANPQAFLWGRIRIVAMLGGTWVVYRLIPCRMTILIRATLQLALLAWWYPDTYEINRILPNLDHVFAGWEQSLFGFQPALVFAHNFPSPIISELLDLGYVFYYPIIALTCLAYYAMRYEEFQKCLFIVMASFFTYYLIFDFIPVVGPTFYYRAIGLNNVVHGVFPSVGDYFNSHTACLSSPGYSRGIFYGLVESAKEAGERPTAAFPSSHVGISTVCMLLLLRLRYKKLLYVVTPIYVCLCLATVYIQAHYAIDAIAGFISALIFFYLFNSVYIRKIKQ
jgi:membrane-associated phospholipid phosphatase